MVVVVGCRLAVIEMGRRDPLGVSAADFDCPPTLIDHRVVGFTRQRQAVDIRPAAAGPVVHVMNLGPVCGDIAARSGTATILRVQDKSLVCRSYSTGPAQVQWPILMLVEYCKVMVCATGHPDEVAHRENRSATGDGLAGGRAEFLQRGRHDDGDRQSVVPPEFRIAQLTANQRVERVVLPLSMTPRIGFICGAGIFVAGLHAPGAANRASHASRLARSSGEAISLPMLIPSERCGAQVKPRRRARSMSENLPSGLISTAQRFPPCSNWSGRSAVACWARNRSAPSTASGGVPDGRSRTNAWITFRCCGSSSPSPPTSAVAGSSGGNLPPVIVVRGLSCSASRRRRRTSAQLIRSQSAITLCTGPPTSAGSS